MYVERKSTSYGYYIAYYKEQFGQVHRENGPAYTEYGYKGNVLYELYFIDGNQVSKEEWYEKYGWKLPLKNTPMSKIFGA